MLCAAYGAEVIKIEPCSGDWGRSIGEKFGDETAFSYYYNIGKKSVALDLKSAIGIRAAEDIIKNSDIIIESFRPGVMNRLGLGYEDAARLREGVLYLSVNGFGSSGPLRGLPATDIVMQAFSGFMYCNQRHGIPSRLEYFIIDVVTGLYAFQSLQAAVIGRQMEGKISSRHLECSMLGSALSLQGPKLIEYAMNLKQKNYYAPLAVYRTADGFVSISVRDDERFQSFCKVLERPDLAADPRFRSNKHRVANEAFLDEIIGPIISRISTDELCEGLKKADILHSQVLSHGDIVQDEHVKACSAIIMHENATMDIGIPVAELPGCEASLQNKMPPVIGEHTEEILKRFGWNEAELNSLVGKS
jgi:crotonobetainyl-CoA:carnitine CoA-transferase CaiB-like acyl-CoA transferase